VVPDKATRVRNFHHETVEALSEIVGAAGMRHPKEITPDHIMVRNAEGMALPLATSLPTLGHGVLFEADKISQLPEPFRSYWRGATSASFALQAPAHVAA
jgi:hypothetical protein